MRYITAFNGKTLHDGTSRFSISKLPITKAAEIEKVRMANGQLFDPNYGTGSQVTPQPFDATFFMRFSSKAAAEAEEVALANLVGSNGTVTANKDSGGAVETCNASLKSAPIIHKKNDFIFTVTLNFEPFTDWS